MIDHYYFHRVDEGFVSVLSETCYVVPRKRKVVHQRTIRGHERLRCWLTAEVPAKRRTRGGLSVDRAADYRYDISILPEIFTPRDYPLDDLRATRRLHVHPK